ncbi:MAG: hypothetical protein C0504_08175 [Candidatus Solibacter sp.]|nr:hypothetical protein [Candidatus Solibacter sp.]
MSAGLHQGRESLLCSAAASAERAAAALRGWTRGADARISPPASGTLPAFLADVDAPVEFAVLPSRMATVPRHWKPLFPPLSILRAEGRLGRPVGAGNQPWSAEISFLDRMKAKMGGGALAAAKRTLLETGGQASWWLPARLELLAAGDSATPAIRGRWEWMKQNQADLSAQDAAFSRLALDPAAPAAFDPGAPERLIETQGGEGSWLIDDFTGPVVSTAFALDALGRQGVDDRDAAVLRGGEWLRSAQNADGGWGAGEGQDSAPVRTACAVMGLVAGGDAGSESVQRGIGYLVRTQGQDGAWHDDGFNWALLAGYAECRSTLDGLTLPLIALKTFLRHFSAGTNTGAAGV